ncbi:hypothetical protein F5Y19DRAFT_83393 [Xylariaceae sp. FL1651]|nr:hypothetical protein F5Y19DRAFT_83393 [Xylariaceae sp. FL1651]
MTQEQSLPMAGEHSSEVAPASSNDAAAGSSRDAAPQASTSNQPPRTVEEVAAPPLPQRPTGVAQHQPLPQPFYSQQHQIPYAPYPLQPNQQFTYATPVQPLPKQSQAWIGTKLGLAVLSSIWGIVIIALTSILLSQGGSVAYTALYAYAIVVASILWNTAELITYCVRLRKSVQRGIHPGAHVGLHLILWLAGVFAVLFSISIYGSVAEGVAECENDDDDSLTYYSYGYCDEFKPLDYYKWNILPVLRALVAIFVLWLINHFVLFVFACIDTHKRNIKPATYIMPIPAATPGPAPGMYYPQQPGMPPMQYYPYPVMMQPQQAHLVSGARGAEPET